MIAITCFEELISIENLSTRDVNEWLTGHIRKRMMFNGTRGRSNPPFLLDRWIHEGAS